VDAGIGFGRDLLAARLAWHQRHWPIGDFLLTQPLGLGSFFWCQSGEYVP